jgi:hypothetical protein
MITAVPVAFSFGGKKTVSVGWVTFVILIKPFASVSDFSSMAAGLELGMESAYKGITVCP